MPNTFQLRTTALNIEEKAIKCNNFLGNIILKCVSSIAACFVATVTSIVMLTAF